MTQIVDSGQAGGSDPLADAQNALQSAMAAASEFNSFSALLEMFAEKLTLQQESTLEQIALEMTNSLQKILAARNDALRANGLSDVIRLREADGTTISEDSFFDNYYLPAHNGPALQSEYQYLETQVNRILSTNGTGTDTLSRNEIAAISAMDSGRGAAAGGMLIDGVRLERHPDIANLRQRSTQLVILSADIQRILGTTQIMMTYQELILLIRNLTL